MLAGEPFQLIGGHVALDFINTLDDRFRPEGPAERLERTADIVRFGEQTRLLDHERATTLYRWKGSEAAQEQTVAAARGVRELLARVFYAVVDEQTPAAAELKALNARLFQAAAGRELKPEDKRFHWTWRSPGAREAFELLYSQIVFEAANLLTSDQLAQVRACENATCRWLFLDTSRNRGRRWCDMRLCGNRIKARRFYQQHGKR